MSNPIEIPKLSRASLAEMSVTDVKKLAENYATFITSFSAEVIKAGLKEEEIRVAMKAAAALGDCSSGVMCVICT